MPFVCGALLEAGVTGSCELWAVWALWAGCWKLNSPASGWAVSSLKDWAASSPALWKWIWSLRCGEKQECVLCWNVVTVKWTVTSCPSCFLWRASSDRWPHAHCRKHIKWRSYLIKIASLSSCATALAAAPLYYNNKQFSAALSSLLLATPNHNICCPYKGVGKARTPFSELGLSSN